MTTEHDGLLARLDDLEQDLLRGKDLNDKDTAKCIEEAVAAIRSLAPEQESPK